MIVKIDGTTHHYEYTRLDEHDRNALHSWVDRHGIEHKRVPIGTEIKIRHGQMSIDVYRYADGKMVLVRGEPKRDTVTVRLAAPWPLPLPEREDTQGE